MASEAAGSTRSQDWALPACGSQERRTHPAQDCALRADMELDVERAKELIEQKLAEEEEEEVGP